MSHTHPHEHKLLYRSFNLSFSLFLIRALIISLRYVQSHQRHFLLPFSSTSKIISLFLCLICFFILSFFIAVPFIFAFLQHPLFSLWMFTFALPFPTRFHASDPRSLSLSLSGRAHNKHTYTHRHTFLQAHNTRTGITRAQDTRLATGAPNFCSN